MASYDPIESLKKLSARVNSGTLESSTQAELKEFAIALTFSQAYSYFADKQFHQISETVRLLLLKEYIEVIERRSSSTQRWFMFLAVASIIIGIIQIYYAAKPTTQSPVEPAQPKAEKSASQVQASRPLSGQKTK